VASRAKALSGISTPTIDSAILFSFSSSVGGLFQLRPAG
ncbi:hypothetical protein ABH924_004830, partial [Arthrobacter sp. GAS37]